MARNLNSGVFVIWQEYGKRGYPQLLRPALLAQSIKLVGAGPEAHSVPSAESAAWAHTRGSWCDRPSPLTHRSAWKNDSRKLGGLEGHKRGTRL